MEINFFEPAQVLVFFLVVFVVIFLRYLVVAEVYHYLFYRLFRRKVSHQILDSKILRKKQMLKEVGWSAISAFVFTVFAVGLFALWFYGYTSIYQSIDAYPIWYFPVSVSLALFIQDTYYWLHRWMHLPSVFKRIHKVHHNSVHTSVFTSFSFHPTETVLQALILPLIVMVLPLHIYAVAVVLVVMTLSAAINHAGIEIYPTGRFGKWVSAWIIGATHHDQHHRKFKANYGLYFTFWDRLMGTEAPSSIKSENKVKEVYGS